MPKYVCAAGPLAEARDCLQIDPESKADYHGPLSDN